MTLAGIVCEYNPFHSGHMAHIEKTREILGEDAGVVCIMSGNFVQRGEPAIMEKHARAEAAIAGGADLVLELPTIWAAASAERFALGSVAVLKALGLDMTLSFGSECGDLETLKAAAEGLSSEKADELIREELKGGVSYAAARQKAASELLGAGADILRRPNNILGVEYLKAIARLEAYHIAPLTFPRISTEHDGAEMDLLAPASRIREMILSGEDPSRFMPDDTVRILKKEIKCGRAPVSLEAFERAVLYRLRTMPDECYEMLPDAGEGLWKRLMKASRSASSYVEVLENTKTKRYAMSRIRRMVLCALLGISKDMQEGLPPYIKVLAFNGRGREILHEAKERAELPIITKPAAAKKLLEPARRVFEAEALATDIYTLMYPNSGNSAGGQEWSTDPVFML